jgi:hypothetical protein
MNMHVKVKTVAGRVLVRSRRRSSADAGQNREETTKGDKKEETPGDASGRDNGQKSASCQSGLFVKY